MSHAVGRGPGGRGIDGWRALAGESEATCGRRRSIKVGNKLTGLREGAKEEGEEKRRNNGVRRGAGEIGGRSGQTRGGIGGGRGQTRGGSGV